MAALVRYLAGDKNIKKVFLINMDYSHGHGVSAASKAILKKLFSKAQITAFGEHSNFSGLLGAEHTLQEFQKTTPVFDYSQIVTDRS